MATYHILIIDDKTETRKWLSALVDGMNLDTLVVAVPSGEEALLEFLSTRFDLVITDFALPGMDGLKLLKKAKGKFPGLQGILIVEENDVRVGYDQDGGTVDVTISEPVKSVDLIGAVARCLGVEGMNFSLDAEIGDSRTPVETISERLTRLHQAVSAKTSLLFDNSGSILARVGNLPEESRDELLLHPVIDSFCVGMKVSRFLQVATPFTFQFFSGSTQDLILTQVGEVTALLVILEPINLNLELSDIVLTINEGVDDIRRLLFILGIDQEQRVESSLRQVDIEEMVDDTELKEEAPRIEAVFQEGISKPLGSNDLDAFWNGIAQEETPDEGGKPDMLTYEQALQLGLTPDD